MNPVAPPLPTHNQFSCLSIEESLESDESEQDNIWEAALEPPPELPQPRFMRLPAFERRLPRKYIISTTPSSKSLQIKVSLQTTDTADIVSGPALDDCGATGQFIDWEFVKKHRLTTQKLL